MRYIPWKLLILLLWLEENILNCSLLHTCWLITTLEERVTVTDQVKHCHIFPAGAILAVHWSVLVVHWSVMAVHWSVGVGTAEAETGHAQAD